MDLKVVRKHDGWRLDQFLADQLSLSRSKVQQYIKQRYIQVNDQFVKASYILVEADVIKVAIQSTPSEQVHLIDTINFIYEDDDIAVLNKPVGVVVHSDQANQDTLVDYLKRQNMALSDELGHRPGIVHRLDKMTEGLMVIAKHNDAFNFLKEQFKARHIIKKYYAVAQGNMSHDNYDINKPIARHPSKRHLFKVDPSGKEAITSITVIQRYNTKTLCDVRIKTGRTHQIRVHFSDLGYPILHDVEYGKSRSKNGQLLQAYYLSFFHPRLKLRFSFELPLSHRLI